MGKAHAIPSWQTQFDPQHSCRGDRIYFTKCLWMLYGICACTHTHVQTHNDFFPQFHQFTASFMMSIFQWLSNTSLCKYATVFPPGCGVHSPTISGFCEYLALKSSRQKKDVQSGGLYKRFDQRRRILTIDSGDGASPSAVFLLMTLPGSNVYLQSNGHIYGPGYWSQNQTKIISLET